jgi:hypothetical protein
MPKVQTKNQPIHREKLITADYILDLYKESKRMKDTRERKFFVRDVKKLIQYIGQSVTLEIEE